MGERYIAHMAADEHSGKTLCGCDWEAWQEPAEPPPDYAALGVGGREAVRTEREYREHRRAISPRPHTDLIHQCQACFKIMVSR